MKFNIEKTGQNLNQFNVTTSKTPKTIGTNANDAILSLNSNSPDIELGVNKEISPGIEKTRLFFIFNKMGGFDKADLNLPVPLNSEEVEKLFEQLGLENLQ